MPYLGRPWPVLVCRWTNEHVTCILWYVIWYRPINGTIGSLRWAFSLMYSYWQVNLVNNSKYAIYSLTFHSQTMYRKTQSKEVFGQCTRNNQNQWYVTWGTNFPNLCSNLSQAAAAILIKIKPTREHKMKKIPLFKFKVQNKNHIHFDHTSIGRCFWRPSLERKERKKTLLCTEMLTVSHKLKKNELTTKLITFSSPTLIYSIDLVKSQQSLEIFSITPRIDCCGRRFNDNPITKYAVYQKYCPKQTSSAGGPSRKKLCSRTWSRSKKSA